MMRLLSPWRRDLVCRDAVALVTDYLEGALSRRDRARLERHLADCDGCEEYLRQMRKTILLLGSVQPGDLEPEARDAIVELLLQFRAEQAGDDQ
ncbi:MAG: zf-HC2 domain-containing protein [Acidimicrobiales bacterium]